jgi:23S rRNA pseudouridine2605 synthase
LQGRVSVEGSIVRKLGTKVAPSAGIEVDGQRIHLERQVYLALNKPKGYVSTNHDPAGRPRVVDLVADVSQRVYTVGRLDAESTGLMILTNDGALANRLAHPKYGVEKVYRALVAGRPERSTLDALVRGVWLADGKARARRVRVVGEQGDATLVEMALAEGKNREVRRMWAKLGHKVMRLTRVAIGPISIYRLKAGQWRHLNTWEIHQLKRLARGEPVATAWFGGAERARPGPPRRGPARHEKRPEQGRPASGLSMTGPPVPAIADAAHAAPPSRRRRERAPGLGGTESVGRPRRQTRDQLSAATADIAHPPGPAVQAPGRRRFPARHKGAGVSRRPPRGETPDEMGQRVVLGADGLRPSTPGAPQPRRRPPRRPGPLARPRRKPPTGDESR